MHIAQSPCFVDLPVEVATVGAIVGAAVTEDIIAVQ